jgi:predicted choloylglycine hydrolase
MPRYKLMMPRVNLNGSSAEMLIRQRMDICHTLDKAMEKMYEGMPHGRDYQTYYPDDAAKTNAAQIAWRERIDMLTSLKEELMQEAISIQQQRQQRYNDA